MLTNIDSIQGLSGHAGRYFAGAVLVIFFSVIPIREQKRIKSSALQKLLSFSLTIELIFTLLWGNMYSPLFAFYTLGEESYQWLKQQDLDTTEDCTAYFYRDEIEDYRAKSTDIIQKPNVILIFTEGLSQNIVSDPRNIMPNISQLQKQSLSFFNYYNHTFATYRGIIGQLYSGYQLNNLDNNTLVSIQNIFGKNGYQTVFINTEPANKDFTEYLQKMNFDKVIGNMEDIRSGVADTYSDREAYELLYNTLAEKDERPLFVAMYTFGTHVSFDSVDKKFGDGSDAFLNKFYNLDYQFGEFFEKFNESGFSENTILIFTTDHATYMDSDYANAMPESSRQNPMIDEIPFFIYYKGITPEIIDVQGRNSLDMAPTILDYLDINMPNYFLGDSLFSKKQNGNFYDTIFIAEGTYLESDGAAVVGISEEKQDMINNKLSKYFAAKTQQPTYISRKLEDETFLNSESSVDDIDDTKIYTEISPDYSRLKITMETQDIFDNIWFATWSLDNGDQDDLQWYRAEKKENGMWVYNVDLRRHNAVGNYAIHVYTGITEPETRIATYVVYVSHLPDDG